MLSEKSSCVSIRILGFSYHDSYHHEIHEILSGEIHIAVEHHHFVTGNFSASTTNGPWMGMTPKKGTPKWKLQNG